MPAPTSYPSAAYNATQLSTVVVTSAAAFAALAGPGTWTTTPYPASATIPADPNETVTDTRLQQSLIEQRITNQLLQIGLNINTDPVTELRPDILANDSGLTT